MTCNIFVFKLVALVAAIMTVRLLLLVEFKEIVVSLRRRKGQLIDRIYSRTVKNKLASLFFTVLSYIQSISYPLGLRNETTVSEVVDSAREFIFHSSVVYSVNQLPFTSAQRDDYFLKLYY